MKAPALLAKCRGNLLGHPKAASQHHSSGQTLVEFALVIPIVIFLLVGTFDLGRGVVSYFTLAHVAREGARVGMFVDATDDAIRARIQQQAGILGTISADQITISPAYPRESRATLEVKVTFLFDPVTPLFDAVLGGENILLTGVARVMVE